MQKHQRHKRTFRPCFVQRISRSSKILAAMMTRLAAAVFLVAATSVFSAEPGREILSGHVPAAVAGMTPTGRLPATNHLHLAIGLPLRNQACLLYTSPSPRD